MSTQIIALLVVIVLLFGLVWFLFWKGYPKLHTQKTRYRRDHSGHVMTSYKVGETQRNFEAAELEKDLEKHHSRKKKD